MKLESNIRPIIKGKIGELEAYFLLDTGSNIALLDQSQLDRFKLEKDSAFPGTIIGAGGSLEAYYCTNKVNIGSKELDQFILADISQIRNSIKRETGINILGVISYPQIQSLNIILNPAINEIHGI